MISKPALAISTALILAFLWGYRGDEIAAVFHALFGKNESEHLAVDNAVPLPPGIKRDKVARRPKVAPPTIDQAPAAAPQAADDGEQQPNVPPPTLSGTLDAITPGQIQDDQQKRRNLYFNRLSKQLSKIQPPTQPDAAAPDAAAPTEPAADDRTAPAPDAADTVAAPDEPAAPAVAPTPTPGADDEAIKKELEDLLAE